MTVTKRQLEFHFYLLILYSIKFREFNVRVSFITRVLNLAIFSKSRKSQNLVLAKFSENKVLVILFNLRCLQIQI